MNALTRGNVFRYVWWQIRDRAGQRVIACLMIALAFSVPAYFARRAGDGAMGSPMMLRAFSTQLLFIFALVMASGLIANDRRNGWYRFYLAKPVSPSWFYGQAIVLTWLGMGVAAMGLVLILGSALRVDWTWRIVLDGVLTFALLGMMVVFWSALVRRDWLAGVVTMVGVQALRGRFAPTESVVGDILNVVLPPMHLIGPRTHTTVEILWILGWGVGLAVVTLVTLRRRPLGED